MRAPRNYRHGHKTAAGGSREYAMWNAMRARCGNPNIAHYLRYGGRGIRVCEEWQADFVNFLSDMGRAPSPRHSLERIDNNGHYEPANCRWATPKEQANNRRSNRTIEFRGEVATMAQWAERVGIRKQTLHGRLSNGWTVERALTTPLRVQV